MKALLLLVLALAACNKLQEATIKLPRVPNGSPITLEICGEDSAKILRTKLEPEEIIPGGTISLKLQYQLLKDIHIKDLTIDVFNEGIELQVEHQSIEKDYKSGDKDVVDYKNNIPGFCPPGSWNIFLYLKDQDDNNAFCLKAHFDM